MHELEGMARSRAAEAALAAEAFPVRLGELTRTDDGLLGFFVDDDFEHLHLVDKVVAALAKPAGPEGHLSDEPAPIEHPYLVAEDTVTIHFGQRLTLTLLMHPAGRVHLTSGVLPRKAFIALIHCCDEELIVFLVLCTRRGRVLFQTRDESAVAFTTESHGKDRRPDRNDPGAGAAPAEASAAAAGRQRA